MEIDYLQKCQKYSLDSHYVQGAGGNISFKSDDKMFIKASGVFLKHVLSPRALSEVAWKGIVEYHRSPESKTDSESVYLTKVRSFKTFESSNPSMETGFHAILDKYVIHSHPTVVNVFLCSKEGREVLSELLPMSFQRVPYVAPGQALTAEIMKLRDTKKQGEVSVFLLENHGLIVSSDDYKKAFETQDKIFSICKKYLSEKLGSNVSFDPLAYDDSYELGGFLFPDQIVFADTRDKSGIAFLENMSSAIWIEKVIKLMGWTPDYISNHDVQTVANMQAEAERRKEVPPFSSTKNK